MAAEPVILLVEDNPAHAELARRAFEQASSSPQVYFAETLAEARAMLNGGPQPAPDVVLSDLQLPDGSAMDLLADHLPLVIMTSQGDEQRAVSAIKGGALDYVVKSPEMYRDLPLTVERALRSVQRENERLAAETSLRESEARFRQLADNINEAFWLYDLAESRMVYANTAWARVYGCGDVPLSGAAAARALAIHPEDRARVLAAFERNAPHRCVEQSFRVVDPECTRWVEERTFPVPDANGRPYRVAGLGADITRRRELEQSLLQSQKLKAIGQLAGGVAHDFNNMLTAIMAAAEELGELVPNAEQRALCAMISSASDRASELTRSLLSFSRKGRLNTMAVDLHSVIRETARLLERSIDRRVRLVLELGACDATVMGDAAQLQSALLNLGINARDAMPQGGELRVSTRLRHLDKDACASLAPGLRAGPFIQLSVRDTGIGMSAEIQGRIFEPFYTTKAIGQGTGLGLAAVYGIVVEHGGAVTVYSEVGRGSVFHLYLPASGVATRVVEPRLEAKPGSGLVLLVDDETLVREVGSRLLKSLGYQVVSARDGAEGVSLFEARHRELVAVVCDMVMPVLSGADATARMHAIDPAVPIVICSGYTYDDRIGSAEPSAAAAFLPKPFHRNDLSRVLSRVARRVERE